MQMLNGIGYLWFPLFINQNLMLGIYIKTLSFNGKTFVDSEERTLVHIIANVFETLMCFKKLKITKRLLIVFQS